MSSIVSLLVLIRTAPTPNPLPTEIWIVLQSAATHECAHEGAYDVKSRSVNPNCIGYIVNDCINYGLSAKQSWVVIVNTPSYLGQDECILPS